MQSQQLVAGAGGAEHEPGVGAGLIGEAVGRPGAAEEYVGRGAGLVYPPRLGQRRTGDQQCLDQASGAVAQGGVVVGAGDVLYAFTLPR